MTLPSRHRIRNSNSGGLWPSKLPLGHGGSLRYRVLLVDGEETYLFLPRRRDRKNEPRTLYYFVIMVYYSVLTVNYLFITVNYLVITVYYSFTMV